MSIRVCVSFVAACVAAFGSIQFTGAQEAPAGSIDNITGDLYRAATNTHRTVFLVTLEGIILADPIGTAFATWLKAELAERFDVPVRYVLYSHYHDDHASGGAVFADTAELVGHENMIANLQAVADDPIFAEVRAPDRTYSDRTTVMLGGKTVEMIHALPSHSTDSSIIFFPDERAVFAVDFVNVRRLPFQNMPGGTVSDWIDANRDLQARVDYDIMVPAHGNIGTKADLDDSTQYMVELLAAVTEAVEAGLSLEEAQAAVLMEEYSDWQQYDAWRAMNVQGVYEQLTQ